MKIVHASTPEQEQHIEELVGYIYSEILPRYFNDQEIANFHDLNILEPSAEQIHYNSTLKTAFQIISCLQAIIAIIEAAKEEGIEKRHSSIYEKNIEMLNLYGYCFPFTLSHFTGSKSENLSKYTRPMNRYLS